MYSGENLASYQDARIALRGGAGVEDRQLRLLALAVLASLVLHALLLYALPILKDAVKAPARPLTARLAKPAPPEPPKIEARSRPPVLAQPVPRPAPAARAVPQRPAPAPASVAPVRSVEPAKQAVEPVPAAEAPQATTAGTEVASAPAAGGPDPGSVARFRIELMEIARRYKRYPRIAQDNNWEGRVELRIAFTENGAISALTVKKSAGRAVLDDEAQAMIRSAQPQAAVPPALRGRSFALEIAVDFFLKDEAR